MPSFPSSPRLPLRSPGEVPRRAPSRAPSRPPGPALQKAAAHLRVAQSRTDLGGTDLETRRKTRGTRPAARSAMRQGSPGRSGAGDHHGGWCWMLGVGWECGSCALILAGWRMLLVVIVVDCFLHQQSLAVGSVASLSCTRQS